MDMAGDWQSVVDQFAAQYAVSGSNALDTKHRSPSASRGRSRLAQVLLVKMVTLPASATSSEYVSHPSKEWKNASAQRLAASGVTKQGFFRSGGMCVSRSIPHTRRAAERLVDEAGPAGARKVLRIATKRHKTGKNSPAFYA
jgi:hypothetical protein